MDIKIKNYLGWAAVALMAALAVSALWYVRAYSRSSEPSSYRSFSVSGEGKAVAIPDVAEFSFSVLTQGGKDLGMLQKDNTIKVNRAIGVVKADGVEDKDIKTEQYSVEPRYQYFSCPTVGLSIYQQSQQDKIGAKPCPPPEIVGYTVRQTVSVKVRNFEKVGELLSEVVQSGANAVSQLSFTLDDPTLVQNKAREEAIQKAKDKARAVAGAGGFRLGKLLSIEEGGWPTPVYYKSLSIESFGGAPAAVPAPSIEPGSQETAVTVTLRYEIR